MKFHLVTGDITTLEVDAIVNAANTSLLGGGGVDGPSTGQPVRSCWPSAALCTAVPPARPRPRRGYRLPARYVIHTVGPCGTEAEGGSRELLASCYRTSLARSLELLPHGGLPRHQHRGSTTIRPRRPPPSRWPSAAAFTEHPDGPEITFVCFSSHMAAIYRQLLDQETEQM